MLKYLGLIALFLSAVTPAIEHKRRYMRKMSEYELFIRLADGIYDEISTYMRPISDFIFGFSSELSKIGLNLEVGCDLGAKFSTVCRTLSVSPASRSAIASFFFSLGTGLRDDELRRVKALKDTLLLEWEKDKKSGEGSVGAMGAVCCAVGLIFVILLL